MRGQIKRTNMTFLVMLAFTLVIACGGLMAIAINSALNDNARHTANTYDPSPEFVQE